MTEPDKKVPDIVLRRCALMAAVLTVLDSLLAMAHVIRGGRLILMTVDIMPALSAWLAVAFLLLSRKSSMRRFYAAAAVSGLAILAASAAIDFSLHGTFTCLTSRMIGGTAAWTAAMALFIATDAFSRRKGE